MVFENETTDRDQTAWNIAAAQTRHISNLIQKATDFYLKGNLNEWYWTLTALREMINYDLKLPERTELDNMEKKAAPFSAQWKRYRDEDILIKKTQRINSQYALLIRLYQRKLMDLLKELGYFPKKEDRTKMSF